ncbi:protein-L-isoaspartate(D-aspartate) O-methyltransferase [Gammaproteobacteria bacterium]|nr:protein-L-isoaspartate(D-aspartate) O-methyltransferase [Gammaproteobacteria bacterium]
MSCETQLGIGFTSDRTRQRFLDRLIAQGIVEPAVLDAFKRIPRHYFVPDPALHSRAYDDIPLPIGHHQTVSQPYIVGLMTEMALRGASRLGRVLEIGTGSGYQTAVLSCLADKVYTIERIGALLDSARERLLTIGISNVEYCHGDGYLGWPGRGPYDVILLTSAPPQIPFRLLQQLAVNGRLVGPVGTKQQQRLVIADRTSDGFKESRGEAVRFVPMLKEIV